jgi:predicted short-subunit dehydrogenase-like oxidoreductase (DUF2520 family)
MQTLNIIGAGRVGQTLGRLWHEAGVFAVQDVLTTSADSAQAACAFMGTGRPATDMHALRSADVWMLAVPDAQIASVAQSLSGLVAVNASLRDGPAGVAFHCSGAQSSASLAALATQGWRTASAHCILSFASATSAVQQFAGTACALEGEPSAIAQLQSAFGRIGAQCFEVASQDKVLYHAAAVFATNFLPVLQSVAEDAWRATGVPEHLLPHLRSALLTNAVANITRLGPAHALTGPAARGDVAAIARQAAVVTQWDAQSGAAYEALSALSLRMAKATSDAALTPASSH